MIFAWVNSEGVVLARVLSAAGVLGPIRRLSARGERAKVEIDEPGVTISSGARPVVAWIRGSTVRAAVDRDDVRAAVSAEGRVGP